MWRSVLRTCNYANSMKERGGDGHEEKDFCQEDFPDFFGCFSSGIDACFIHCGQWRQDGNETPVRDDG